MPTASHDHRLAELRAAVELAELEVALAELDADVAAGRVPATAGRGRTPAERMARVDFARLDDEVEAATDRILRDLVDARTGLNGVVAEWLAEADTIDELTERIRSTMDPARSGPVLAELLGPTVADSVSRVEPTLRGLAIDGGTTVLDERAAQGRPVDLDPVITPATEHAIADDALRISTRPNVELLAALHDEYHRLPVLGMTVDDVAEALYQHGRTLSTGPLRDLARQAAHRAHSAGRVDTAEAIGRRVAEPTPGPDDVPLNGREVARIYASELLDSNTCGPCSLVDGREYPTMEAARVDYPHGQYVECEGGSRCRGTLVIVWSTEGAEGGPPAGPPPPGPDPAPEPTPPPPAPEPEPEPTAGAEPGDLRLDLTGTPPPLPDHVSVTYTDLDPDAAGELDDLVRRLSARYPTVADRIGFVGSSANARRYYADRGVRIRIGGGFYAWASNARGQFRGALALNGSWFGKGKTKGVRKLDRLRAALDRDLAANFHPKGASNMAGVIVHEFGHHVFYAIRGDGDLRRGWEGAVARRLRDELGIVDPTTSAEGARAFYEATTAISRYATTNADERFAEAFANALVSDPADVAPLARIMVEEADRLLRAPGGPR